MSSYPNPKPSSGDGWYLEDSGVVLEARDPRPRLLIHRLLVPPGTMILGQRSLWVPSCWLPNWSPNQVRLARYAASPDTDGRAEERVSLEKARRGDRTGFKSASAKALMGKDKAARQAVAWAV